MFRPQRHILVSKLTMSTWRRLPTGLRPTIHRATRQRVTAAPQVLPQFKKTFMLMLHFRAGLGWDVIRPRAFLFSLSAWSYCPRRYVLQPKKRSVHSWSSVFTLLTIFFISIATARVRAVFIFSVVRMIARFHSGSEVSSVTPPGSPANLYPIRTSSRGFLKRSYAMSLKSCQLISILAWKVLLIWTSFTSTVNCQTMQDQHQLTQLR